MQTQTLKDRHGHITGFVETRTDGVMVLKDEHRHIRGYYDPRSDQTKDAHMHLVGYGNTLLQLLG